MKLPYNPNYCFYLESMEDVRLFNRYISCNLARSIYTPVGWFRCNTDILPQYVFVKLNPFERSILWGNSTELPPGRLVITLDALSNPEQYPELFI